MLKSNGFNNNLGHDGFIGYFLVAIAGLIMVLVFVLIVQVIPNFGARSFNFSQFSFFQNRQQIERVSQATGTTTPNPTPETLCFYYDFNSDNQVNQFDVDIINKNVGQNSASLNWNPKFDLNKDKIVDATDVQIIQTLADAKLSC